MILGIIGSGQLGYMMINTMRKYPMEFYVIDKNKGPAGHIADKFFYLNDYKNFVDSCDYVTFEFEQVDETVLKYAEEKNKLRPNIKTVDLKKDRLLEKDFLRRNNLPVAEYKISDNYKEAFEIAKSFGKGVIKSRHGGYDGKNQYFIDEGSRYIEEDNIPYVIEKFIDYDYEASIIAVRNENKNFEFFDPSFNYNKNGILIYNIAPLKDYNINNKMIDIAKKLMDKLKYIGVMGIEFYVVNDSVIINEYSPRVHNTGHHTLLGSSVSQFEEHVRSVMNLNIIKPVLFKPSGILNIIGTDINGKVNEIIDDKTDIYWYHKSETIRKRKMGHINIYGDSYDDVSERINKLINTVYENGLNNYI